MLIIKHSTEDKRYAQYLSARSAKLAINHVCMKFIDAISVNLSQHIHPPIINSELTVLFTTVSMLRTQLWASSILQRIPELLRQ